MPLIAVHLCRDRTLHEWGHIALPAPFWRFYWNPTPGAWVARGSDRIELTPARWALVSPGPPFETGHEGPFEQFFIHFTLGPMFRLCAPVLVEGPVNGHMKRPLQRLRAIARNRSASSIEAGLLAERVLVAALERVPIAAWAPSATDIRIRWAAKEMLRRRHAPPSVAELAQGVGMHPKSFSRLFRKEMGLPPHRYGLELRLDGAAEQLMHTDDSVDWVADAWGFSDRYHLSRLLSRYRGVAPGKLRTMHVPYPNTP